MRSPFLRCQRQEGKQTSSVMLHTEILKKKKKKVSVLSYIYIIFCSNSVLDARTGGLIRGVQHGYGKVDVPSRQHFHSA